MSSPLPDDESNADTSLGQVCTYILRIDSEQQNEQMMRSAEIRFYLQALLGPEHDVLSVDKLKLNSSQADEFSPIHNVVKVKTCKPMVVANKLMGDKWIREDHVLFKYPPST
eukprot:scaffold5112_cov76-Skeletonema_menzelii.AAC.3